MVFRFMAMLLALVLGPTVASAIVNVDQAMLDPEQEGLTHFGNLSLDGARGNTNKQAVKADWLSRYRRGQNTEFLYAEYSFGKSSGRTDANRLFAHLRHRTQFAERWAWELFGQYGRDPFARLALRVLTGGGLRYVLTEPTGENAAYVGLGAFHEWERLSPQIGTTDRRSNLPRLNGYLVLEHRFNAQVRLNAIAYFQPAVRDPADYRLLAQGCLKIRMNEHLDWQVRLDYGFDARPPQAVKSSDLRYSAGLSLQF